jgi:uncharacterized protein (TIGR00297 family)
MFSFLTFNYKKFHLLHKTSDESLGTLFYPIGILSSYILLYKLPLFYFQTSLMVLAVSDTLANFSGLVQKGNIWIRIFHDKKSLYGIAAYTLSIFAIFFLYLPENLTLHLPFIIFALLWAVNLEIASKRGSDNLTIPLGLALLFLLAANYDFDYIFLSSILMIMAAGCFLLFKSNILTRQGSYFAFLLGFYFAGFAGWQWLLAILLFFLSSAAFTKLHHVIKDPERPTSLKDPHSSTTLKNPGNSSARNAWQVIANIIWALISSALYLLTQNEIFMLFFIAFVAAVTADTWASEIGPLLNKKCFSPSKMKMMPAGTNGGISFYGSLAALAAAVLISSFSYYLFFKSWDWYIIAILSVSAFLACFADSFLGAFVENKMLHMNYFKKRKSSESISPNDLVNMMGSLTAFVFYLLLTWITSV